MLRRPARHGRITGDTVEDAAQRLVQFMQIDIAHIEPPLQLGLGRGADVGAQTGVLALVQQLCSLFETAIFEQLADQRIADIFLFILQHRLRLGQQTHRLEEEQLGGDHEKISQRAWLDLFQTINCTQILIGHRNQANLVDVEFILFDQLQQQIKRSFKDGQVNRIGSADSLIVNGKR